MTFQLDVADWEAASFTANVELVADFQVRTHLLRRAVKLAGLTQAADEAILTEFALMLDNADRIASKVTTSSCTLRANTLPRLLQHQCPLRKRGDVVRAEDDTTGWALCAADRNHRVVVRHQHFAEA